ncbi:hypothetical protein Tco_1264632 [Tanacetum coccineum]
MGCHILSLLEELYPQSLGRSIRCRYMISKKVRIFLLHLVFTSKVTSGPLLEFQCTLTIRMRLFFKRLTSRSMISTVKDVKRTVNSAQLLWEFKSIGNGSNFGNDLKRSNIKRVKLSSFAKTYHSFPWRYFQHDLISHLKLKGFPSYVGIALLTIMGSLNMALDLNNLLSFLVGLGQ